MHKNNKHHKKYDFNRLVLKEPLLKPFVFENEHGTLTIDFANAKAVKMLNTALLKTHYDIDYWEFPDGHLCPPIPNRVDYIHHVADLLKPYMFKDNIKILDVGTGATCIYPLLGHSEYKWHFVATDIDEKSLHNAQEIIKKNNKQDQIELRLQRDKSHVLLNILESSDKLALSMCNPPFYKNAEEALKASLRKLKGLGLDRSQKERNFGGTANELWFKGGEKAFLHTYLYESSLFKSQCFWYSSLVSSKDLVKSMEKSLKKLSATEVKVIPMKQGHKISRIVAWTFLTKEEQKYWQA